MAEPVIGVTAPSRTLQHAWWFTRRAVRRAGGSAKLLTPGVDLGALRHIDAIVLGGGSDIDPVHYRQAPAVASAYDEDRDAFELRALEHAIARGLPVLGICRGAQLLNVFLGGTLHQSLSTAIPEFRPRRTIFARKTIMIEAQTHLREIMQTRTLRVNSLHNQGVDGLGEGLRVSARDHLGVVQAIEGVGPEGRFVVGVQWHPEYLFGSEGQRRLFEGLVTAASNATGSAGAPRKNDPPPAELPGRRSTPVEPPKRKRSPPAIEPERDTPPPAEPPDEERPAKTVT